MSSITIAIEDFSSPHFEAKNWINSVLKPNTTQDDGVKDTTILVTKLQMVSESTSRQFDQLSTSVLQSMPRILYDLKVISEAAHSTHQGVEAVKKNLGLIEGDTEDALEKLRKPHTAKVRMEECHTILLEKSNELQERQKEKEALESLMRKEQEREKEERVEKELRASLELKQQQEQEQEEEEEKRKLVIEEPVQVAPIVIAPVDEGLEYGHVQLPPLRSTPRRITTPTTHQVNNNVPAEDNSYLQQIQDSMTPSNMFKRIGVPLDKFWQS
ncbi:hypothetical protein BD770DRAFT_476844 [Pilaira anomala]|nr:hypothetical protein BD770DRAFT_476844 [Pilaira anomala]